MNFTACFFFLGVSQTFQTYFSPAPPQAPGESAAFAGGVFFWSRKTAGGKISDRLALSPHSWLTLAPREPVQHNTAIDSEKADGFGVKKSLAQWVFTNFGEETKVQVQKGFGWGLLKLHPSNKKKQLDWVIFERKFTNLDTVCLKID